jgi:hypothetical protein
MTKRAVRSIAKPKPGPKPVAPKPDPVVLAFHRALRTSGWQKRNLQMWAQAQRLGKLIAIQQGTEGREFPPGCCFLHAALPSVTSFCIRRVVEVDLDACTATIEIHGDDELEAGHVVLPLEAVGWFGFPAKAVAVGVRFRGFIEPEAAITAAPG